VHARATRPGHALASFFFFFWRLHMNASKTKTLSLVVALSGAVACGAFVGCSSTDTTVNPAGDDGGTVTPGTDSSTPLTDSGPPGTDASGDDNSDSSTPVDAGPATVGAGSVVLSQTTNGSTYSYTASAGFGYETTSTITSTCAGPVTISGTTCTFYTSCATAAPVDAGTDSGTDAAVDAAVDAAAPVYPQAGVISITGLSKDTSGLSLDLNSAGTAYTALTGTTQQFVGGDKLTFAGVGDANSIGAFSIADVVAPADINITAPTFTGTTIHTTSFDRSADKTVTWTGGATGSKVTFQLSTYTLANAGLAGASKIVTCTFDSGAGTGVIPSAGGLANLDKADGTAVFGSFNQSSSSSGTSTATNNDTSVAGAGILNVSASVAATPYTGTFTNTN
jgi:hypothetical protein